MHIKIPGKTFLLGEYAALQGGLALIACTTPCFDLKVSPPTALNNVSPSFPFHLDSPAGKFLQDHQHLLENRSLQWSSPYPQGGLGGSTAEFLASYQFYWRSILRVPSNQDIHKVYNSKYMTEIYQTYLKYAYSGNGIPPSGMDLIAQTQAQITFIQRENQSDIFQINQVKWPFQNISLLFFKTPTKLATHTHLTHWSSAKELPDFSHLSYLTHQGYKALYEKNLMAFIQSIHEYALALERLNLTTESTINLLSQLRQNAACLAAKGCGALGADVIIALVETQQEDEFKNYAQSHQLDLIATHQDLLSHPSL